MNPEERQALREWHKPYDINGMEYCNGCRDNDTGYEADGPHYPCDVIQVLDAFDSHLISCDTERAENRKFSNLKTEVECGHMDDERYGEIVFNGIVYKLVPTDHGRGPRSRKKSECSHVLASKQPKLFGTGEFIIDIMVANCWCPKCGEKL